MPGKHKRVKRGESQHKRRKLGVSSTTKRAKRKAAKSRAKYAR